MSLWGGNKGLGFTLAKKLLSCGAYVTISGRDESKLKDTIHSLGSSKVDYLVWDICDVNSTSAVIKEVLDKHKSIDCFINNAGIYFPEDNQFLKQSQHSWDITMNTN